MRPGKPACADGRNAGHDRRRLAGRDRQELDAAGLDRAAHDRERRPVELEAAFGDVVERLDRIAVGHLRHVEALALEEGRDHQIGGAGDRGPVQLAGLRARHREQLAERFDVELRRRGERDQRGGDARDRREIARIVRQLVVQIGMRGERGRRAEEQHVVVVRADESVVIATKPSPPGRFSTTTGWPHFAASFSAISRAPMSAPEPGPSGRMMRTGRVGQILRRRGQSGQRQRDSAMREPVRILAMRMMHSSAGRSASIRRGLDAEQLAGGGDLRALRVDRRAEFRRAAGIDHLAGGEQAAR